MANLSIRGVDEKTLTRLRRKAQRAGSSLNRLVVRILQESEGAKPGALELQKFDDLDTLAGTWTRARAREFERNTAELSEVDASLWK